MNTWAKTIIVGVALLAGCEGSIGGQKQQPGSGASSGTGNTTGSGTGNTISSGTGQHDRDRHGGSSTPVDPDGLHARDPGDVAAPAPDARRVRQDDARPARASTCSRRACSRPTRWAASISAPGTASRRPPTRWRRRCMANATAQGQGAPLHDATTRPASSSSSPRSGRRRSAARSRRPRSTQLHGAVHEPRDADADRDRSIEAVTADHQGVPDVAVVPHARRRRRRRRPTAASYALSS